MEVLGIVGTLRVEIIFDDLIFVPELSLLPPLTSLLDLVINQSPSPLRLYHHS